MTDKHKSWGDKPYRKDMDFSLCEQSKFNDKYGTPKEIANAIYYYDKRLENSFITNSITLLIIIQKGLSNKEYKATRLPKPDNHHGMRPIGTDLQIANKVHHTLDWLRATDKRTWDSRGLNPSRQILDYCIKGMTINSATLLHYDEDPNRQ